MYYDVLLLKMEQIDGFRANFDSYSDVGGVESGILEDLEYYHLYSS